MRERWYRGYGLLIRSELALPEFEAAAPGVPDVTLRLDPAGDGADHGPAGEDFVPAPGGGFVLDLAGIGCFLVRDGREIVLTPAPGADPGLVRLFTVGSAFGMLLHQRGVPVMHGAAIDTGNGAVIVVGETGAGKSTLAAQLGRAGLAVLGDDVMPVWPGRDGGFEVIPGSRVSKLWSDALAGLGVAPDGLEPVANRAEKFYFPNPGRIDGGPRALAGILELATHDGPPRIAQLSPLEAVRAVAEHTYRPGYVGLLGREAAHFRRCAALAARVPVARLLRPRGFAQAGETVALLIRHWGVSAPARSVTG